jgi:hypothetical protein
MPLNNGKYPPSARGWRPSNPSPYHQQQRGYRSQENFQRQPNDDRQHKPFSRSAWESAQQAEWSKDIENGSLVTLDWKCSDKEFQERKALSCVQSASGGKTDPPLVGAYLSPEICKELGTQAASKVGGWTMKLPVHKQMTRSAAYQHVQVSAKVEAAEPGSNGLRNRLQVRVLFAPDDALGEASVSTAAELEEGEVLMTDAERTEQYVQACPTICKTYYVTLRMWSSYMTEDHGETKGMYVHGMRKAVSNIAWWACPCEPPAVNLELPTIPMDMSLDEFVRVLKAMRLEVSQQEPTQQETLQEASQQATLTPQQETTQQDAHHLEKHEPGSVQAAEESVSAHTRRKVARHATLWNRLQTCNIPGGHLAELIDVTIKARKDHLPTSDTSSGHEMLESTPVHSRKRVSIYPVGMLNTRMISLIDGAVDIVNFMRHLNKKYVDKNGPASVVLGAYNALVRRRLLDTEMSSEAGALEEGASGGGSVCESLACEGPTCVEDVPCEEMQRYGALVCRILANQNPYTQAAAGHHHGFVGTSGVRRFDRIVRWDAQDVLVACVRLGSHANPFHAFAFCTLQGKGGREWVPFALSGMRHEVFCYLPAPGHEPSSFPLAAGRDLEQDALRVAERREAELGELCRQVSPEHSTLPPRQRFALQQSVIINGCSLYPKTIGRDKLLLRDLSIEWFQRRGHEMQEGDIATMLTLMPTLKCTLNPYWWFACCMA